MNLNKYILILFLNITIFPYSWETSKAKETIDKAVISLYNHDFDTFNKNIKIAEQLDKNSPIIPFLKLGSEWQRIQLEEGYSSSYKSIMNNLDIVVPYYLQRIDEQPDNPEYPLYLGSSYGMVARISLAKSDYINVLVNGYYALKYVKNAQNLDSNLYDAYMPIGLMEYFACKSNASIKGMSDIFGINSNCEQALELLEIARNKSKYSWIETSNILVYAYLYFENNYEKSLEVINHLRSKFPDNPFYLFIEAEVLARLKDWEQIDVLWPSLLYHANNGPLYKQKECFVKLKYIESLKLFSEGKFNEVIIDCDWIIDNYTLEFDWLKGFAYLLVGKAYDAKGNRELAIYNYKKSIKLTSYFPEREEAYDLITNKSPH